MNRKIYTGIIILIGLFINAQNAKVGIKTADPTETLDVNGSSYTNSLYLRNPGNPIKLEDIFLPLLRIHWTYMILHLKAADYLIISNLPFQEFRQRESQTMTPK